MEVTNFGPQGPLSVDKSPCSLIVEGWGGGIVGISNIKAIRNSFLENNCSNSKYSFRKKRKMNILPLINQNNILKLTWNQGFKSD